MLYALVTDGEFNNLYADEAVAVETALKAIELKTAEAADIWRVQAAHGFHTERAPEPPEPTPARKR